VLNEYNISELIPQSLPFVMIDSIVSWNENTSVSRFTVREDHILCQNGRFREPGIIENMAQTAALHAGLEAKKNKSPIKTGYIGSIKNLSICFLPKIDEIMETRIILKTVIGDIKVIDCRVTCSGKILAECEITIVERSEVPAK
jgi:predicted hotdog family 3-hydroxylacyl-ACP dehydratase